MISPIINMVCENEHKYYDDCFKNLSYLIDRGVVVVDKKMQIIEFNHAAEKITGTPANQVLGKSIYYAFPKNVFSLIFQHLTKINQVKNIKINYYHRGVERKLLLEGKRLKDNLGRPGGFIFVFNNDLAYEEAACTIDNPDIIKQQYAFILDAINYGVIGIDKNFICNLFNKGAENILGLKATDIIGKNIYEKLPSFTAERILERTIETGTPFINYSFKIDLNNKNIEMLANSMAIFDEGNQKIGAILVFNDVSNVRIQEQLLAQHESISSVSRMAAGLAHEIRNPLTSIKGFVQLLQNKMKEGVEAEYIDIILEELDRTNKLLSDFMLLSKPRRGEFKLINLGNTLQKTIELMKAQAVLNDVEIKYQLDTELPVIKGCEEQLKQVFINLIRNAIEAIPNKGIIWVKSKVENKEIKISFSDNGIGISKDSIDKIFTMLYTTKETGNGLGLAVSSQIIGHHGGRIDVESDEGSGTTFTIILPLK